MSYRKLAIAALCCAALSACVVAPVGRPYGNGYGYGDAPVVVDVAPPAPYDETVPVMPFVGAVWIGGYWGWNGGRHTWVPGRYGHARPGYAWEPHRGFSTTTAGTSKAAAGHVADAHLIASRPA